MEIDFGRGWSATRTFVGEERALRREFVQQWTPPAAIALIILITAARVWHYQQTMT
jgi:hypothetical protein